MIRKQDILDRATDWGIRPEVVEKDYVLGWVLAAFSSHPLASSSWVFKGGTCLKKCFFETYRFSEDLDFSLTPDAPYDEQSVRSAIVAVMATAAEMSGISVPLERIELKVRRDKLGRRTFQGRVAYQGPLVMHVATSPARHHAARGSYCTPFSPTDLSSLPRWASRCRTRPHLLARRAVRREDQSAPGTDTTSRPVRRRSSLGPPRGSSVRSR